MTVQLPQPIWMLDALVNFIANRTGGFSQRCLFLKAWSENIKFFHTGHFLSISAAKNSTANWFHWWATRQKLFLFHYHPQSSCPPGNILRVNVNTEHKVKNERFFSQLFHIFNRSRDSPVPGPASHQDPFTVQFQAGGYINQRGLLILTKWSAVCIIGLRFRRYNTTLVHTIPVLLREVIPRIRESVRLEKTYEIIKSNIWFNNTMSTRLQH